MLINIEQLEQLISVARCMIIGDFFHENTSRHEELCNLIYEINKQQYLVDVNDNKSE